MAEAIFIVGILFFGYEGYLLVAPQVVYVGIVLLLCVCSALPCLTILLLYHVHMSFLQLKKRRPASRGIAQRRKPMEIEE